MTSNVGGELKSEGLGFQPADHSDRTMECLRQRFRPEFLGRLDEAICFKPLKQEDMQKIAGKYLSQLKDRAEAGGMQLQLPEQLAQMLAAAGTKQGGARSLRRLVQEKVETPLATFLLSCHKKPGRIRCSLEKETLRFY